MPLVYLVVQSAQAAPQQRSVSAVQDDPLAWNRLAQVKTQTLPPQDAVPFSTAAQSVPVEQPEPGAQAAAHPPPQSTSVSSPSFTWSVQEAAQTPFVHNPLMQLRPAPSQAAPKPHFAGQLPPQSTSVSSPSFTPFEQALTAHLPSRHTPLAQSGAAAQATPLVHFCGQLPPQSTAVSDPFRMPSPQVASRQVPRTQESPPPQGLFVSSQMDPGAAPHPAMRKAAALARIARQVISEGKPETDAGGGRDRGDHV